MEVFASLRFLRLLVFFVGEGFRGVRLSNLGVPSRPSPRTCFAAIKAAAVITMMEERERVPPKLAPPANERMMINFESTSSLPL